MTKRRTAKAILLLAALGALLAVGSAQAIRIRAGDLVIIADGGFRPVTLPKNENAPITLYGGGRLETVSGDLPPIIRTITIEYDRHGSVITKGLPVCTQGRLEATIVAQARRACGGAIVGKGKGSAMVAFPEQRPFKVSSPITLFNGPKKRGQPTVLAHAYTTVPVPTTFIVPVVIEKINKGVFGYRTEAKIPRIAGGYGIPVSGELTIGKKWTHKGKRLSYINARCATGVLQARGLFGFKDGTVLRGSFAKRCKVR
jgi:hypothetical protein